MYFKYTVFYQCDTLEVGETLYFSGFFLIQLYIQGVQLPVFH